MWIDRNNSEVWMQSIIERFDRLETVMYKPEKQKPVINGEKLLDNHVLCFMLNCSKRSLQRFLVSGLLACRRISQKTYYLESDVMIFIRETLKKSTKKLGK